MARVRLFAMLREAARKSDDEIDASSIGELVSKASDRYGSEFVRALPFTKVAVNGTEISELDGEQTKLEAEDEVAFLPPVSGGSDAAPRIEALGCRP